jgi:trans-aconitate methyltransferase
MLPLFGIFLPLTIAALIVYWSIKNGIGPLPSTPKQTRAMLNCFPENVEGSILELGSGWGRLALAMARRFPENKVVAYESSPIPYLFSRIFSRRANLHFYRQDFLDVPLSNAGAIVCYLYPGGMEKLKPKLDAELTPGTLVVTNTFAVPGWKAETVVELNDLHRTKIYVYRTNSAERIKHGDTKNTEKNIF